MYIPEEIDFDKYDEPRLHMERLMRVRLTEFDIPLRILLLLERGGVKTLGDLCSRTREELMRIPQIGSLSADRLEEVLTRLDLSFKK